MALSIFVDALPYTEIQEKYKDFFENGEVLKLIPNIAYSSSLHWQLYCNKYPDERGCLVDWVKTPEKKKVVRILSTVLSPIDYFPAFSLLIKKILDRFVFRGNIFANIPFRFRKDFCEKGRYLFWDSNTYSKEKIFKDYVVVSQDESHISFSTAIEKLKSVMCTGEKNIFFVTGFADEIGHKYARGKEYSDKIKPFMDVLHDVVNQYVTLHPEEEVIIVSDHGMSTVFSRVDLSLEKHFGRQSRKSYIAYSDSAIMCVWVFNEKLKAKIKDYLSECSVGHLLSEEERAYYKATDSLFGDFVFILKEGNVFSDSWFGKSIRKRNNRKEGMHGFWPDETSEDQMGTIILINEQSKLNENLLCTYKDANRIINRVMADR